MKELQPLQPVSSSTSEALEENCAQPTELQTTESLPTSANVTTVVYNESAVELNQAQVADSGASFPEDEDSPQEISTENSERDSNKGGSSPKDQNGAGGANEVTVEKSQTAEIPTFKVRKILFPSLLCYPLVKQLLFYADYFWYSDQPVVSDANKPHSAWSVVWNYPNDACYGAQRTRWKLHDADAFSAAQPISFHSQPFISLHEDKETLS